MIPFGRVLSEPDRTKYFCKMGRSVSRSTKAALESPPAMRLRKPRKTLFVNSPLAPTLRGEGRGVRGSWTDFKLEPNILPTQSHLRTELVECAR